MGRQIKDSVLPGSNDKEYQGKNQQVVFIADSTQALQSPFQQA